MRPISCAHKNAQENFNAHTQQWSEKEIYEKTATRKTSPFIRKLWQAQIQFPRGSTGNEWNKLLASIPWQWVCCERLARSQLLTVHLQGFASRRDMLQKIAGAGIWMKATDRKFFKACLNGGSRKRAAQRATCGAYCGTEKAWALVMSRPRDPSTTIPVPGASLRDGSRHSCMVLLGRIGGEGKSFLLAPLRALYGQGQVQSTPQHGNFPFLGLETKKVVLMDDCCVDDSVLALPTQLLWYEGNISCLHSPRTQPLPDASVVWSYSVYFLHGEREGTQNRPFQEETNFPTIEC